jgi:hypothetical protein
MEGAVKRSMTVAAGLMVAFAAHADNVSVPGELAPEKRPADAKEFFVSPKDGDTVSNPVKIVFGVSHMTIAPAGHPQSGSGHHHLIIDAKPPPANVPLPADEHVLHFGKGQTETTLTLPSGSHTLQLEFADYRHLPFDPPLLSEPITITVK